jgi:hypothetical protein
VSDTEVEFELVTSAKQLVAPPPMRTETVILKEWKSPSGKPFGFKVWEITSSDYDALIKSGWTFYPDGTRKRYTHEDADIRQLTFTVRDPNGNRLWNSIEEAKRQLRPLGRSCIDQLVMASNRVNSVKQEDTEGNSDGTTEDSSPTT